DHPEVLTAGHREQVADVFEAPVFDDLDLSLNLVGRTGTHASGDDAYLCALTNPALDALDHRRDGSAHAAVILPAVVLRERAVEIDADPAVHSLAPVSSTDASARATAQR